MMNKRRSTDLLVLILAGGLFLGGCSVQDKALTLPVVSPQAGRVTEEVEEASDEITKEGQGTDSVIKEQLIYVHVCGAVQKPGVVMLPVGSRGTDAIAAAGGFCENACEAYVNLAAQLTDGQQLYIPDEEEGISLKSRKEQAREGLVNINTAGEEELCTLPGIGSTRAKEIIAYRQKHGDFLQKEDIMQISGIKESIYNKICDKIMVE